MVYLLDIFILLLHCFRPAGGQSTWTATACDFISDYLRGASAVMTVKVFLSISLCCICLSLLTSSGLARWITASTLLQRLPSVTLFFGFCIPSPPLLSLLLPACFSHMCVLLCPPGVDRSASTSRHAALLWQDGKVCQYCRLPGQRGSRSEGQKTKVCVSLQEECTDICVLTKIIICVLSIFGPLWLECNNIKILQYIHILRTCPHYRIYCCDIF